MIATDRLPVKIERNHWSSLEKNRPKWLFPRFVEQVLPLMKTVALNNQLLHEEYGASLLTNNLFDSINTSLTRVEKLIENYGILAQLYGGEYQVRLTDETPALIVGELNDQRVEYIRIANQDQPGLIFKADHGLLTKALNSLLDTSSVSKDYYDLEVTSSENTVSFILHLNIGHTGEWDKTISAAFFFEALEAMQAKVELDKEKISIAFLRVNYE